MSDVTKEIVVSKEVDELVGIFVDAVLQAKAGQLNVIATIGSLVTHFGAFAALPAEIKNNTADSIEAVSLQMGRLISGLAGVPQGD